VVYPVHGVGKVERVETIAIAGFSVTTYVITFAELSDTGGLLMYEVPPGPTGGGVIDLWQRPVSDTGMVGPDRGKGGKLAKGLYRGRFGVWPKGLYDVPKAPSVEFNKAVKAALIRYLKGKK
jgi:hypothetical protein